MATCRDLEGWTPVSQLRDFDLTLCFEEGILLSTLLVVLLVSALSSSYFLAALPPLVRSPSSLRILYVKVILLTLAICTSAASCAVVVIGNVPVGVTQSYLLEALALATTPILTIQNHKRSRTSSTILLLFWPCYIAGLIVWDRTTFARHGINTVFILKCVVAVLGLSSFFLEYLGPEFTYKSHTSEEDAVYTEHPLETANIYSILTFGWMTPLMRRGASKYITEDDLPPLPHRDDAAKLGERLQNATKKHKSLWIAIFSAFGASYSVAAFLKIIHDCLAFLQPQLLRLLLAYISDYQNAHTGTGYFVIPGPSPFEGFAIAILMFSASLIQTAILHQYFQRCFETGMRVRAGLVTAIYKKALVLSTDKRGLSSGDIVNLMSVDAMRMQELCGYGIIAISGPFQIALAFISLYNLLGWSAFVGVAIMVLSIPLNTVIARILKKMQEKQMKNRDKRTRLMSELLANIKSVKLYAWEYAFIRRVLRVRNDEELKMLRKIGMTTAFNSTLWSGIPLLVAFSSFAVASVFSSRPITADVIFPAMSLFNLLQFPLAMISQVTSNIIEAMVSVKRLSQFFHAPELQSDARKVVEKTDLKIGDEVLHIRDGEFWWSKDAGKPTLQDINLTVKKGELLGVLGRVGAGKTSLLSAIVGDMIRAEGHVIISGTVAYASQNPWIMSATVRDNILFSHVYEETFYDLVLEACALKQDLALLPQGDLTEVGEKGITLSGGQRARVALARAVYARADLVLIDDALAAVDSHVARHIFDNVIGPHGILASKARILVTNSISFLKQYDELIFLRRGIILDRGSYTTLSTDPKNEIYKLVQSHSSNFNSSGSSTPWRSGTFTPNSSSDQALTRSHSEDSSPIDEKMGSVLIEKLLRRDSFGTAVLAETLPMRTSSDGPTKEHSEQGRVNPKVYTEYIKAASRSGFALFTICIIAQQATSVFANLTLRAWGDHNAEMGDNSGQGKYLTIYGLLSLSSVLCGGVSAILLWVLCTLKSARYLHDSMLHAVMRTPLSFFELTPIGRILNLFSRDTYVVDQVLARVIQNVIRTFCVCLGILVVIGSSFPLFLVAMVPLAWFYQRVMVYYLATSRELKRLDAVSRSPIFAWFSESLGGLSIIRAFNQQGVFISNNERRIDRNQICYLPSIAVNRWLAIRLELVGSVIILIAAMLAMTALVTTGVDAGLVGLVLSYGLSTTSSLNWLVRSVSEVEQNIVSVERILHYVGLEPEAPDEIPENKPTGTWPSSGEVVFQNYSMRYRPDLDLVLKNVSVTIKPREKIGICGRTGAGKSSLLLALFRILEPASGTICIDGVDITKLGLHDLRSAISIVPQSPDLFEGTMRENIDPTGEYQDAEIWIALSQSRLKEFVESLPEGLDSPVREGGASLSSGQRQLLCFARALLRKSKILVLDEATSAVDLDTDAAIQEIIRGPQFADVTMFTIAHRLNTIMESDRIMVLSAGEVVELDAPSTLLSNPNTQFYSLAAEAGLI